MILGVDEAVTLNQNEPTRFASATRAWADMVGVIDAKRTNFFSNALSRKAKSALQKAI